jgi:hypothetical protein
LRWAPSEKQSLISSWGRIVRNDHRYHFADFTFKNYRRLITLAKSNYRFRTYTDFNKEERFILWRHDVDFSPEGAMKMAAIEADEGIIATYFLCIRSNFYNLLEDRGADCVREIARHGHCIGLHFDSSLYEIRDEQDLETCLQKEKAVFHEFYNQEVRVFSFHMTTSSEKTYQRRVYAGMLNTHSEVFRNGVGYCSDSNGYWRFRRLEDVLLEAKDERLQVLTHPVWWQDKIMSPKERLLKCIEGRANDKLAWYEKVVKEYGRENVDWD